MVKLSLLDADPILFSPIYVNTENVSTEKLLSLYRFANIFFPRMGSNLVSTIMDMEKNSERIIANCPPEERRKLIRRLKDLSVDLSFMVSDEPVGRRLDFLMQEFLREVNTLSSKIANAKIAHLGVEMKNEIEKLREQVQNIE